MAETGLALSPQSTADSDSRAAARGGINRAGLLLALVAVSLLLLTIVAGTVKVITQMRSGEPAAEPVAPAAPESRKEQLLRRLEEVRARINALEKRRDELSQAEGAGEEDKNLDARLAVGKELNQAREEEDQVLAELEGLSREPEATGR